MARKKAAGAPQTASISEAKKSGATNEAPPEGELVELPEGEILHQIPGLAYDHVKDHQNLTETFKKEDKALFRLADLQNLALESNPNHLAYKPNPYNRRNHQYVIGKVMSSEPPSGFEDPNKTFLDDTRRTRAVPTAKEPLPLTSSQEIGWFTKVQPVDTFLKDRRVNYPKRYCDLSRYMDVYWGYYPPPPAKFHPKDK